MNHTIKAHSPLGSETLRFRAMTGLEALSTLFEFEVDLVADSAALGLSPLLGQPMTLEIETKGAPRYLDGIVARAMLVGREGATTREYRYRATMRPWLWLLTQTRDCKIFQNQSVPQILQAVLGEYGYPVEPRLTASYRSWTYCVQYQETDFDFISRLMEHEGIYYYFEHALGSHTLVLADAMAAHAPLPGHASIPFFQAERVSSTPQEAIDAYAVAEEIAPGAYVTDDYNFTKPGAQLTGGRASAAPHAHGDLEVYDWMGGYGEADESAHVSRIRLEELQAERERDAGHAYCRGMAPGYRFTLTNCPRDAANREYLLVSVRYRLADAGYASVAAGAAGAGYECDFVTHPATLPFRPRRLTPRPHTHGPQTAVVVGPPGETIWTDEYGRVKVQFRWDRIGAYDENSSCWLRVASSAAGAGMGQLNIPRIGQEVVVDFIGGQPDRPIVIGCTYNADMMTAFGLPAQASRSGFVSRTLKGGPAQANHLFFEDKPGAEELALHAERNYVLTVENDKTTTVGNDQFETVGGDAAQRVGGSKFTQIGRDHVLKVGAASDRTVDGSSAEVHGSDYGHTTVGPSTLVRQAAHVQRYGASYEHHVTGAADSTYAAPHVHAHSSDFSHHVRSDHEHVVGGLFRQHVLGDHVQQLVGDVEHSVEGSHATTVTGDHVHTVGANHALTAMGDSHHATTGTHTLAAKEIHIGGDGGGGAAQNNNVGQQYTQETNVGGNTVTGLVSVKAVRLSSTSVLAIDSTVTKFSASMLNLALDPLKVSSSMFSLAANSVEIKMVLQKRECVGAAVKAIGTTVDKVKSLREHTGFAGAFSPFFWRK